jgi:hypothetical protein
MKSRKDIESSKNKGEKAGKNIKKNNFKKRLIK